MPPMGPQGPMGPPMPPPPPQPKVRVYDLTAGSYDVSIVIGKSWDSRLEQGADEIGELLKASPDMMPIIGPLYFKYRDFPGHNEIGELMRKMRAKMHPELEEDDGEETPEQLKAIIEAGKQQMMMLQQQLQEATQQVETEQAKQQAVIQRSQIEAQSKAQTSEANAQVSLQVEEMKSQSDAQIEEMKANAAEQLAVLKHQFEMEMLKQEQRFEAMQQQLDRRQEAEMAHYAAEKAEQSDERDMMHETHQAEADRKTAGEDE